ncbi:antiviral reverse transcriptase Drt3a [Chitinophaga sp. 22620]|uniref:antiviral reverse transcriptase Drt3a n=1 Tax=Chitinophaga sp. 22620 TaxID=3453952 RepID=UPI003F86BA98
MLDQSFSAENFRSILDYENRKGKDIGSLFFPAVATIIQSIKQINGQIRDAKKRLPEAQYYEEKKNLSHNKDVLIAQKDELLSIELQKISDIILSKKFKIEILKNDSIGSKPVYTIANNPEIFFALKQTQYNFRKLYKVKQANRYLIISQLKTLLNDGFPKLILRTDIKDFYERIPHARLLEKLNEENLLSFYSKRVIAKILSDYKVKSGNNVGLPRGIGISAYLVELYMRDFDNEIKELPNIIYYSRYVDDIVIVFAPSITREKKDFKLIIEEIAAKYSLDLNPNKTQLIDNRDKHKQQEHTLEYLGYQMTFGFDKGKGISLRIKLTSKKKFKYLKRIADSFQNYANLRKVNEKKARKIIVKRLRFLTGNTRLINNKRNVIIGIYFSNSFLTDLDDLKTLDWYLRLRTESDDLPEKLKIRISNFSFEKGFISRTFSRFTTMELSAIMKIWKNH